MTDHIGIVACSAPGAALCYETICAEAQQYLGPLGHPEVSLHAFNFADHYALLQQGDWAALGKMLADSAAKLASVGADFVICPDNTAHQALDHLPAAPEVPWLHIVEPVAEEARRRGTKNLGLLGTQYLMEDDLYPSRLTKVGVECRVPSTEDRRVINRIIFEELVLGQVTPAAVAEFDRIIRELRTEHACDAIILGCTELPLAITSELTDLPLLDSTRLLARAAIRRAVDQE